MLLSAKRKYNAALVVSRKPKASNGLFFAEGLKSTRLSNEIDIRKLVVQRDDAGRVQEHITLSAYGNDIRLARPQAVKPEITERPSQCNARLGQTAA